MSSSSRCVLKTIQHIKLIPWISFQHDAQPSELEIQMEVERLVVAEFAEEQHRAACQPDVLQVHGTPAPGTAQTVPPSRKPKRKTKQK